MKLHELEIGDVVAKLRPRTLLTQELERGLKFNCLRLFNQKDDKGLVIQPLLDSFGIEIEDLLYMAAYLWVLSPRVASLEGADFDLLKRTDADATIVFKLERFMASEQTKVVNAIDQAITKMDAPIDKELAPNIIGLNEEEKKTG